uniref:Carbonic anhydrase n=1 Tax=Entomoneis paludosa TaxID=265537 RepID=A0A7S3DS51_9STRA
MLFSTALKQTAAAVAKQGNVRGFSMVARAAAKAPATMAKSFVAAQQWASLHTCGPNCAPHSNHSCRGAFCGVCQTPSAVSKTAGVRQMSTEAHGMDVSTPAGAIAALEAGNERFVKGDIMAPNRNMERLKELEGGQAPFAAFLSCADSRVPVEMIFDQGFGDVFICRIAGNIVNTETIGSLEFGCAVLGAKVLYVMGHSSCGAVNATMAGAAVPGVISSLYYGIKPACNHANGDLDTAIAENVKYQVAQLETSPVLKELVEAGKLEIVGGVYDLTTGKVNRV